MSDEKNLDAVRDEKCFPVAQAILSQMAVDLLNKNDNQKELTESTLSVMLDKDFNITEEVAYVPQLILGALSGLNLAVQTCTVIEADETRIADVGSKMLRILADANVKLNPAKEDIETVFEVLKEPLNALFAEEKVTRLEIKYVMQTVFEAFTALNNLTDKSIKDATERLECKILGIESMSDLTLKKVNDVLLTPKE